MKNLLRNLAFAMLVAALTSGCVSDRGDETIYATFEHARDANAIGNWLPTWLPRDASNIRERHRVDLPVAWIRFEVSEANGDVQSNTPDQCVLAAAGDLDKVAELTDEAPTWWPNELLGVSLESAESKVRSLYRCNSDLLALVVEENRTVAYVWRLAGEYCIESKR